MNRRQLLQLLCIAFPGLALPRAALASTTPEALAAAAARLMALSKAKKLSFPIAHPALRIRKADRVLELRSGETMIKTYTVALGSSPLGPKRLEGDRRTPEGRYFVTRKNEQSQFHLFLGLSYPNAADAAAGVKAGTVSAAVAARIASLNSAGAADWGTGMGGAVGIHGGGTGEDWTWGCIALSNEDIEELWVCCPEGTPVEIVP